MKKRIYLYIVPFLCLTSCMNPELNTDIYGITDKQYDASGLSVGSPFMNEQLKVIPIGSPSQTTGPGNDLQNTDLISSGNYIGYFGNNNNWNFRIESNWNFEDSRMDYAYQNFYTKIFGSWHEIAQRVSKSKDPHMKAVYAMSQIVKIIGWLRATDVFGPIPYTDAGKGSITPKMNTQKEVYEAMMADLVTAINTLQKTQGNILEKYDLVYNGNPKEWVKLANSILLRMAVRVHFVDADLAKKYIQIAVDPNNGGLIKTLADMARVTSSPKLPLISPYIASVTEYGETRMGATIWSYLMGYNDPRLSKMFSKGTYEGNSGYYCVAPENYLPKLTKPSSPMFASAPLLTESPTVYWFKPSETFFLLSEASLYNLMSGDAKSYYENGVRMSFLENGCTGIDTYLQESNKPKDITTANYVYYEYIAYSSKMSDNNISPNWDDISSAKSDLEQHLQQIITQKYIALYPNAVEAWTEYRRTGYPLIAKPFDPNAASRIEAPDGTKAPERFKFSSKLYDSYPATAIEKVLGGKDNGATKLWWVRKDRPTQQ